MTAHRTQGYSRPRHPTARRSVAFLYLLKTDSVRERLRSSVLRRCLWRSKLRLVSCGRLRHCPFCGAFR
jgi:hypothetical protein